MRIAGSGLEPEAPNVVESPVAKRRQKLKVFRTPIGFHDAYVAATSRKAALAAWGSSTDLFSAGIAEEVSDEKSMKAALERPGEVIRVERGPGLSPRQAGSRAGSAKEHSAALERVGKRRRGLSTASGGQQPVRHAGGMPAAAAPRASSGRKGRKPSRAALDKAENALAALEKKQAEERGRLEREERALAKRREGQEDKHAKALERATARRDEGEDKYRAAMAAWESAE